MEALDFTDISKWDVLKHEDPPMESKMRGGMWVVLDSHARAETHWARLREDHDSRSLNYGVMKIRASEQFTMIAVCMRSEQPVEDSRDEVVRLLGRLRACGIEDTVFFRAARSSKNIYYAPRQKDVVYPTPEHPDMDGSRIRSSVVSRDSVGLAAPPPNKPLGRRVVCDGVEEDDEEVAVARQDPLAMNETIFFETPSSDHGVRKVFAGDVSSKNPIPEGHRLVFVGDEMMTVGEACTPKPPKERMTVSDFVRKYVSKTAQQCLDIEKAEQRSLAWKHARKYAVTTSQFGAAAGLSPYSKPTDVVIAKLWETFSGNAATRWGTEHEPRAAAAYLTWAREDLRRQYASFGTEVAARVAASLVVEERGLIQYPATPWMGASPDGIARWVDPEGKTRRRLVEYKCPYFLLRTAGHPYAKHGDPPLPPQYRAQIQGVMGMFADEDKRISDGAENKSLRGEVWGITDCDFVVWQPKRCWVSRIPFDRQFWKETLDPALQSWFAERFLPAAVMQYNGVLKYGTLGRGKQASAVVLSP